MRVLSHKKRSCLMSIEENIRIARLDASHEEIVDAAQKASLHAFVMILQAIRQMSANWAIVSQEVSASG